MLVKNPNIGQKFTFWVNIQVKTPNLLFLANFKFVNHPEPRPLFGF